MFKKSSRVETIQPVRFKQVVERWLDKTCCNPLNGTHYRGGGADRNFVTSLQFSEHFKVFCDFLNVNFCKVPQLAGKREFVES